MFIKPYFRSKTIYNNKLDELNKLETLLLTLELTIEPIKPAESIILPLIKRG